MSSFFNKRPWNPALAVPETLLTSAPPCCGTFLGDRDLQLRFSSNEFWRIFCQNRSDLSFPKKDEPSRNSFEAETSSSSWTSLNGNRSMTTPTSTVAVPVKKIETKIFLNRSRDSIRCRRCRKFWWMTCRVKIRKRKFAWRYFFHENLIYALVEPDLPTWLDGAAQ